MTVQNIELLGESQELHIGSQVSLGKSMRNEQPSVKPRGTCGLRQRLPRNGTGMRCHSIPCHPGNSNSSSRIGMVRCRNASWNSLATTTQIQCAECRVRSLPALFSECNVSSIATELVGEIVGAGARDCHRANREPTSVESQRRFVDAHL